MRPMSQNRPNDECRMTNDELGHWSLEISHSHRPAFTVIEALVALVILGICGTYFVQLALWHLEDGVRLRRRALALEHATNVLEEVRHRPWEDLQVDSNVEHPVPDDMIDALPQGVVRIRIGPYDDPGVRTRRITVEVGWKERKWVPSIELVAFRSPRSR